jgi:acetylornithine/succinyldiaminopimelate/putrescine aminotransferase
MPALAVLETMLAEDLPGRAARLGEYALERVRALRSPVVKTVRGKGLIIGIELTVPARGVVASCMEQGLLVLTAGDQVLRMVPPLIVTEAEIDEAVGIVGKALQGAAA